MGAVYIISGAATSSIRDSGNTASLAATTTPATASFTTTNAKDIIMCARIANELSDDAGWTAGSGFTKCPSANLAISTTRAMQFEYQIVSATGTYTGSMTAPSNACIIAATAFKESAVAAVVLPERITARRRI